MPAVEDASAIARRIVEQVLADHEARSHPTADAPEGVTVARRDDLEHPDTPAWRAARRIVEEVLADHAARHASSVAVLPSEVAVVDEDSVDARDEPDLVIDLTDAGPDMRTDVVTEADPDDRTDGFTDALFENHVTSEGSPSATVPAVQPQPAEPPVEPPPEREPDEEPEVEPEREPEPLGGHLEPVPQASAPIAAPESPTEPGPAAETAAPGMAARESALEPEPTAAPEGAGHESALQPEPAAAPEGAAQESAAEAIAPEVAAGPAAVEAAAPDAAVDRATADSVATETVPHTPAPAATTRLPRVSNDAAATASRIVAEVLAAHEAREAAQRAAAEAAVSEPAEAAVSEPAEAAEDGTLDFAAARDTAEVATDESEPAPPAAQADGEVEKVERDLGDDPDQTAPLSREDLLTLGAAAAEPTRPVQLPPSAEEPARLEDETAALSTDPTSTSPTDGPPPAPLGAPARPTPDHVDDAGSLGLLAAPPPPTSVPTDPVDIGLDEDVAPAPPRRTGRWLLTTIVGAVALALLFPLAVRALRELISLS